MDRKIGKTFMKILGLSFQSLEKFEIFRNTIGILNKMATEVYRLSGGLLEAIVVARPALSPKSPYLADIMINGIEAIAHTPALGCHGLVSAGRKVLVSPRSGEGASKYVVYCGFDEETGAIIGIHPTISNVIVSNIITRGLILHGLSDLRSEVTCEDCRFDFAATDCGYPVYIEVKNVPIADIVDCKPSLRERLLGLLGSDQPKKKMAIFPHGDKRQEGTVSERALKHVQTLKTIVSRGSGERCIMIYLTQRTDCDIIKISELDTLYRNAVLEAREAGVEVIGLSVEWTKDGVVYFNKQIEVI